MENRLYALEETVKCLMRVVGFIPKDADVYVNGASDLQPPFNQANDDVPAWLDPALIRLLIMARTLRAKHFDPELMQDPAWTMLLELAWADLQGVKVSVTSLCIASGAPDTTALRYLKLLENEELVARRPDPKDGRRSWISMTPVAREKLAKMMQELRRNASIYLADLV